MEVVGPKDPTRTAASPPAQAFEKPPEGDAFPEIAGYRILRKLGQGGQGQVYLAESMDGLKKQTAIKLFPREAKASYARELEAWRRVEEIRRECGTPHLVEGYTAGETRDGQAFVVMAFFEKASLADRLATHGPLPASLAVRYARHVLAALELLHTHGLFHRDVKPQNVLLGSDGIARLADYGLSKPLGASVTGSCTPAFAAPEQLAGESDADGKKIDIYGVGATLFALLVGKPPVPGRPDIFLLEKMKVPRPIQAVLLRALNPDAQARFSTAAELAKALAQADPTSSGVFALPDVHDIAGPRVAADEPPASPTVASANQDSPFIRTPDVSAEAITRSAPPEHWSAATRARATRAKGLVGLAALFAIVAFVADALRDPTHAYWKASIGGPAAVSTASREPTPEPTATASPARPPALVLLPRGAPLPLEGVRELAASDTGLALVSSVGATLVRPSGVAFVPGDVAHAVPWGESALVARLDGSLELVSAKDVRALEAGGPNARIRALAGHVRAGRIAVARRSGVVLETLDASREVASRTPLAGAAPGFVTALAFDDPGERLAVASLARDGAGRVSIFRCTGEPLLEKSFDDPGPLALAWIGSGTLAVGGLRGEVATLDLATGRRARTIHAFEDEVTSLVHVPTSELLIAFGDDRRLETTPRAGTVAVRDDAGTVFYFGARPRPRLLAWPLGALAAPGDLAPALDGATLDPVRLR